MAKNGNGKLKKKKNYFLLFLKKTQCCYENDKRYKSSEKLQEISWALERLCHQKHLVGRQKMCRALQSVSVVETKKI
jgi:hypothetical protein